jgi:hypothetical protein
MAKRAAAKRIGGLGRVQNSPSPMAVRRAEQAQAEADYPDVKARLDEIKYQWKENLIVGRYGYKASLLEIYELICKWNSEDKLEHQIKAISRLRGVALRDDANKFSGIVAYCNPLGGNQRRNNSRYSLTLDKAFEKHILPAQFMKFLN